MLVVLTSSVVVLVFCVDVSSVLVSLVTVVFGAVVVVVFGGCLVIVDTLEVFDVIEVFEVDPAVSPGPVDPVLLVDPEDVVEFGSISVVVAVVLFVFDTVVVVECELTEEEINSNTNETLMMLKPRSFPDKSIFPINFWLAEQYCQTQIT